MMVLMIILWGLLAVALVLVVSLNPERTRHSWFELNRRGDDLAMRREGLIDGIMGMRRLTAGLIVIGMTAIGIASAQLWGVAMTILFWLMVGSFLRVKAIKKVSRLILKRIEPWLLDTLENNSLVSWFVKSEGWRPHDQKLESIEQLVTLIESSAILNDDQRNIVLRGIDWHTTPVGSVMTPRKDIVSIKHSELLGPLVLDDLHRSGHGQFPVIKGGLDNIMGILDISRLLEVNAGRRSETAEKAMTSQVLYIEADEPLPVALKILEKGRQHLLVVIDDNGKTAGIVTLSDITGSLLKSA